MGCLLKCYVLIELRPVYRSCETLADDSVNANEKQIEVTSSIIMMIFRVLVLQYRPSHGSVHDLITIHMIKMRRIARNGTVRPKWSIKNPGPEDGCEPRKEQVGKNGHYYLTRCMNSIISLHAGNTMSRKL